MYSALQFLVARLNERDIATDKLIAGTGLRRSDLDDPWPYLAQGQYCALVRNIYQLTGNPLAGFHLNSGLRASHIGLPGFACLTSPSFIEARGLIRRYRVMKDPAVFPVHNVSRHGWQMKLMETYPLRREVLRFTCEGYLARTLRFCREVTGIDRVFSAIDFTYPRPTYAAVYEDIFSCEIRFGQPQCNVIFEPNILNAPSPNASAEMFALCARECDLRLNQLEAAESVKSKVYQEIYRNHSLKGDSLLGLAGVAGRLYISPRTLRRKLLAENTSFQKIANEVRRDLALYYLAETSLSTKEVAFSLGYSTVNNFHRAFKEWTGNRISDVRLCG